MNNTDRQLMKSLENTAEILRHYLFTIETSLPTKDEHQVILHVCEYLGTASRNAGLGDVTTYARQLELELASGLIRDSYDLNSILYLSKYLLQSCETAREQLIRSDHAPWTNAS